MAAVQPLHGLKLVIKEEVLPMKDQPEFRLRVVYSHQIHGSANVHRSASRQTIDVPMLGTIIEQNGIFFRPTPYGFRQVVQHVSNHVACEIN